MFTIALPTGRVMEDALELLRCAGLPVKNLQDCGRNLVIEEEDCRYVLAKPMDVPLYAHYGIADLALAGSDVLWESGASLVELADTGRGKCRLAIAGPEGLAERFLGHESEIMGLRIATKYPRIADAHFSARGILIEIVHLHGSIELAPRLGMSDCILDIVQTGGTLRANKLVVIDEIAPVSLRLVASRKSAQLKWERIHEIVERIREGVEGR